jgi:hypothetical protein
MRPQRGHQRERCCVEGRVHAGSNARGQTARTGGTSLASGDGRERRIERVGLGGEGARVLCQHHASRNALASSTPRRAHVARGLSRRLQRTWTRISAGLQDEAALACSSNPRSEPASFDGRNGRDLRASAGLPPTAAGAAEALMGAFPERIAALSSPRMAPISATPSLHQFCPDIPLAASQDFSQKVRPHFVSTIAETVPNGSRGEKGRGRGTGGSPRREEGAARLRGCSSCAAAPACPVCAAAPSSRSTPSGAIAACGLPAQARTSRR